MSYIDETIITMRKSNSYVRTILDYVVGQCPNLDEIVCLCRVCEVLDKEGMAVSRAEVRRAMSKYYHKDYHGSKQEYLNWIYKTFHIKTGTKVNTSNVRSQASGKRAISCISGTKEAQPAAFQTKMTKDTTKPLSEQIQGVKVQNMAVLGGIK